MESSTLTALITQEAAPMSAIRVAVVSDDCLFSEGLSQITREEGSFVTVPRDDGHADVALLDSRMTGSLRYCSTLRSTGPSVIFVAAPDDHSWQCEALRAGARGILSKTARTEDLVSAIRIVHQGLMWAPRQVIVALLDRLAAGLMRPPGEAILEQRLSTREREVFRYAAMGLSNKAVAHKLAIREATVKVHLTHIFQKLGVSGRSELAAAYYGILPAAVDRSQP